MDGAITADLSLDGQVQRLAQLYDSADPDDAAEYAALRTAIKDAHRILLSPLDKLVSAKCRGSNRDTGVTGCG